jgi:hypothetical protein
MTTQPIPPHTTYSQLGLVIPRFRRHFVFRSTDVPPFFRWSDRPGNGGCPECMNLESPPSLLLEHFFDLSDLFFNFAGICFGVAFGL